MLIITRKSNCDISTIFNLQRFRNAEMNFKLIQGHRESHGSTEHFNRTVTETYWPKIAQFLYPSCISGVGYGWPRPNFVSD